MPVAYFGKNE